LARIADSVPARADVAFATAVRRERVAVTNSAADFRPDLQTRVNGVPFISTIPRRVDLRRAVWAVAAHGRGLPIESSPHGMAVQTYLPPSDLTPSAPG